MLQTQIQGQLLCSKSITVIYETLLHFLTRLIYKLQKITIKTVNPIWYRPALFAHRLLQNSSNMGYNI